MNFTNLITKNSGKWVTTVLLSLGLTIAFSANQNQVTTSQTDSPGLSQSDIEQVIQIRKNRISPPENVKYINRDRMESLYQLKHASKHEPKKLPAHKIWRSIDKTLFSNKSFRHDELLQVSQQLYNPLTDSLSITINGVEADTITVGDSMQIRITFPDGSSEADLQVWVDMNDNGTLEPEEDWNVDNPGHIMDNGPEDEDPQVGVYQWTISDEDEESPQRFSNITFLMEVMGWAGGYDIASVHIEPIVSDYSISGTVSPELSHILVMAFPWDSLDTDTLSDPLVWGASTDTTGAYHIFLPDTGLFVVAAFDFLGVTGGLIPDTIYFDIDVQGHETGYDFTFSEPHSVIAGVLRDESMAPIPDVNIWIDGNYEPGFEGITDANGYFHIPVPPGEWRIEADQFGLLPDYLVPNEVWEYLDDYDSVFVELTAYVTDAQISGHVTLNDGPWPGINIGAWSELGWTQARTDSAGWYTLNVSSAADPIGGYWLWIWDFIPHDFLVIENPENVLSGEMHADFVVQQMLGGLEGIVYDATTNIPVSHGWVHVYNDFVDFGWGTDQQGYYYLPLPNGAYFVEAGGDGYENIQLDTLIVIQDNVATLDIYLNPLSFDGLISGFVLDETSGMPVMEAQVMVFGDMYWDMTYTDMDGHYSIPVPYGHYAAQAWKEGYGADFAFDLELNEFHPDTTLNFYLVSFEPQAVLEGVVRDAEEEFPIWGANVIVANETYQFMTFTDENGEFYLEVPADSFHVFTMAPEYEPSEDDVYLAIGDTLWLDIYLDHFEVTPPEILSITDVPNDQGRQVRVTWEPGNPAWFGTWQQFSIWRMTENDSGPVWDFITTVPYHGMDVYSFVAPTLVDSNATTSSTGEYWTTFVVTAHTMVPDLFFDSEPESGYSVDNLIPSVPQNLTASYYSDPGTLVMLNWESIEDEDFDYYTIYRGTAPGVLPSDEPYGYTVDTSFVDQALEPGQIYYYVVTAVDFNGNESAPSNEADATVLSTDPTLNVPDSYALSQNYPNPFNPVTTLSFDLPEANQVKVTVHNLLGEVVVTLVDDYRPAGRYTIQWDAREFPSGMYLVRMESGTYGFTRKMMLLK